MDNDEIIKRINLIRIANGSHYISLSERQDTENYKDLIKAMNEARADERTLLKKAFTEKISKADLQNLSSNSDYDLGFLRGFRLAEDVAKELLHQLDEQDTKAKT